MANWNNLKASISEVIKTNNNQEITGQALQNVLNNLVSNLGANATFAGVATPTTNPGAPDGNVFYLAGGGTYTNFNNLVIETGQLGVLMWKGSWSKQTIEIGSAGGNFILDWSENKQTTRLQVLSKYRKAGLMIAYNNPTDGWINEQYVGTLTSDTEWQKDDNWVEIVNSNMLKEVENKILPLLNADVCDVTKYKTVGIGQVNYKMSYSDASFGNLGTSMTILLKFISISPAYQAGVPNIIIQKGDYKTDGWAIMYKNENGDNRIYLCVKGTYYPILSGLVRLFTEKTEIAITSGKTTKVYLFNKEILSLDNVATDSDSAITVGGESDRYSFERLCYLSFTYYERALESIADEFETIYHNFIRTQIEAQFVACPLSLNDYGYSTNEQFSLVSTRTLPAILITTLDLSIPTGYINGISEFDSFDIYQYSATTGIVYKTGDTTSNYAFTTKKINTEGYKAVEIHNVHSDGNNIPILIFLGEGDLVLDYIIATSIKSTQSGTYTGYRDTYTFEFPNGTKKIAMLLKYNSYFKLIKENEELIEAKELTSKHSRIYERTPIILFDSAQLISAFPILSYKAEDKWMSVTQSGNILTISTTLLTGFVDTYKVYNAVYKGSDGNIGIIHVYRTDNSGKLYILENNYPDDITAVTTHAYNGSGEMHLSSNGSKAVGYALVEATKDTLNYLVNGIAGYLQTKQLKPKINGTEISYLSNHKLSDPLGRTVFNVNGIYQTIGGNELIYEWGIYQNTYNTVYLSTEAGKVISLKQIARYKRGYYEISAVSPKYNYSTKENVSSSQVTCTVKNNGKIIDKFIVNNWITERKCVFLDERNTSEYLLNVNKTAGDKPYNLQAALNAVSTQLNINTILMFKNNDNYYCYTYKGDNEAELTRTSNWALFEWGNVEILFEQENEGKATLFINRVLQVEENTRLIAYPITSDSYVAWLGDSWTYAADDNENNTGDYPALKQYDYDDFENKSTEQPTENKNQCPLPRALVDKTNCKLDLWGRGTKTAAWAWQYQVWRIINTKKYTHIVIEYFSNDQSSDNDNVAEVTAIARLCQQNGIIPIIFGPTTAAKSYWYNQYRMGY